MTISASIQWRGENMSDYNDENTNSAAPVEHNGPLAPTTTISKPSWDDTIEVPDARAALVREWLDKIAQANRYWKKPFDRMRACQQLATHGAAKEWLDSNAYVVPIATRYINQAVASLYAKDPKVMASRRKKLMYQIWDEDPRTLAAAIQGAQMGDPAAGSLIQELMQVAQYNAMVDKLGKSLVVCWDYFCGAQAHGFKQEMKSLVRRSKVNGVAYVKLCFQRALEPNPEITAEITDITDKIAKIEAQLRQAKEGEIDECNAQMEELRLSMKDLQDQEMIVVREGPVFDWPRSTEIIPDPAVRHLKTWAGAGWIAHKFDMTPAKVLETYKIDVGGNFTKHYGSDDKGRPVSGSDKDKAECRLYEVQDKTTQMVFTVCEGYPDFIKEPAKPDVYVNGFWTIYPLVFNEVESEEDVFPPSDVWAIRHAQQEINRARQGVREHRMANRPKYIYAAGSLEDDDLDKFETAPAHATIPVKGMRPEDDIAKKLQRFPNIGIDPNQYETETSYQDIQRSVGAQEADLGGTSNNTATESSIAAGARSVGNSDNIDEIDDFLTVLARATGEVMLRELSKDTVIEIAGPGCSWPEMQPTREEISKELFLEIKAGSSGRPNKAAELANIERAVPYLIQLPGVNPMPLAKKYADLLEIDVDELFIPNLPSIVAQNAAASRPPGAPGAAGRPQPGTGDAATDPAQQGGQGAQNAPSPAMNEPGGQPGFPAPHEATPQLA